MIQPPYHQPRERPVRRLAQIIGAWEPLWPLPLIAAGVLGVHTPLALVAAAALALMPRLVRLAYLGRVTQPTAVGGALMLLVAGALVGKWVSYDPALSRPALLTLLGSVGMFFAIVNTTTPLQRTGGALVVAATLIALYFVGLYSHFDYAGESGLTAQLGQITGSLLPDWAFFTPHPNAVAGFLEGALLLGIALTGEARGIRRAAWGLATATLAYALLVSGSRGAWMGTAIAVGAWALLLVPHRPLRWCLAAVGVVGLFLVIYLLASGIASRLAILDPLWETVGSRAVLYRNSLYLLRDYPLTGAGLGDAFSMVYSRYQLLIPYAFLTYPHNLFLSIGLGYGLLGLGALFWLLIGFYWLVACGERAGPGRPPLFRPAWLGTTAIFIHGLTDSPHFSDSRWTMPMLFALLGLAVAAGAPALRPRGKGLSRRRQMAAASTVAGLLLLAAGVCRSPLAGTWYANLGAVYQARAELSPNMDEPTRQATLARASAYFQRALHFDPSQPVANRRLGMMALDRHDFTAAVAYLERAYPKEPNNQATLKSLGLAYLWTGALDRAEALLGCLDNQDEIIEELNVWSWWWGTQDRDDLSTYAKETVQRLSERTGTLSPEARP